MVLMFQSFDFTDFERFLYGESWNTSDFFEQTYLKIARFARLNPEMRLFWEFSNTVLKLNDILLMKSFMYGLNVH